MPNSFALPRPSCETPSALNLIASLTPHSSRSPTSTRSTSFTSQKGSTKTLITCEPLLSGVLPETFAEWPSLPSHSAVTTLRHSASTSDAFTKIIHLPAPKLCSLRSVVSVSTLLVSDSSQASLTASMLSRPHVPSSPSDEV